MSAPGNKQRLQSGGRNDWRTPDDLFRLLNDEFDFTLDAAASAENAKCARFYSEQDDAFRQSPSNETIFCNPPYGKLDKWIDLFIKWSAMGNWIVALVPSATETAWWARAFDAESEVRILTGRVQFLDPETGKTGSNTTGSTVFVFRPHGSRRVWRWNWKAEL